MSHFRTQYAATTTYKLHSSRFNDARLFQKFNRLCRPLMAAPQRHTRVEKLAVAHLHGRSAVGPADLVHALQVTTSKASQLVHANNLDGWMQVGLAAYCIAPLLTGPVMW